MPICLPNPCNIFSSRNREMDKQICFCSKISWDMIMCMIVCNGFLWNHLFQFASLKYAKEDFLRFQMSDYTQIYCCENIQMMIIKNLQIAKTKTRKFENIQRCIYCQYYWPQLSSIFLNKFQWTILWSWIKSNYENECSHNIKSFQIYCPKK